MSSAALAVISGCRTSAAAPGVLTVLINAEPVHLDPRYPGDALGATIARLVYDSLLDSDPVTFAPRLALAERVDPRSETEIDVLLRDGLRFQDGSPITSRDVEATYRSVLDPSLGSTVRGTYADVFAGVRALDERTTRFTLTGPDGTYPSLLQLPIVRAADAARGEIIAAPGNERRFVGSGPLRVASLDTGVWEFERASRAPPHRAQRVRFLTMHDPNTLALRLLHGAADVGEIKPELFDLFQGTPHFGIDRAPSAGVTYLGLRNDHPLLADRDARRAIAHAIDRHALVRGKFGPYAVEATGPLPPSHWAYEPDVARYPYDPDRARTLLAAARARTGVRDGPPLLLRASNVRFVVTVCHALAEMFRAIGLRVDVRQSDLAALLADLRAGRFDLTALTMPDLSDPWGLEWLLATRSIPTPSNPRAGGNRWRFRNAALDAQLAAGRTHVGEAARRPFYAAAQRIIADELPIVSLWHADLVFARGPRVGPLHPRGDGQWEFLLDGPLAD